MKTYFEVIDSRRQKIIRAFLNSEDARYRWRCHVLIRELDTRYQLGVEYERRQYDSFFEGGGQNTCILIDLSLLSSREIKALTPLVAYTHPSTCSKISKMLSVANEVEQMLKEIL